MLSLEAVDDERSASMEPEDVIHGVLRHGQGWTQPPMPKLGELARRRGRAPTLLLARARLPESAHQLAEAPKELVVAQLV